MARAEDCERLVADAVAAYSGVDILVNNAGTAQVGAFESVTYETWQADLDLKLFAAVRYCRLVISLDTCSRRRPDR